MSQLSVSSRLPIESVMSELLKAVEEHSQVILKAPPGAGKSTFLPLQLLKLSAIRGKIVLLEPRRLAARNIASYLASQLGEKVGETVGYRVRGEVKVSDRTRLEIVTEGILTRMLQSDPELEGVELLIFDEFHERSIHADTALAFSLEVQEALREDLKILVMSATLDQEALISLLPRARYIESEGRSFPVEFRYMPLHVNDRLVPLLAKTIVNTLENETGSVLVFLPSVGAIQRLESELEQYRIDAKVFPLYGRLDFKQQELAISPCMGNDRKVVLATNIAETSLTIEGIRIVIDSGLERVARFDLKTGITRLEEARIAQSSATQRAGRAGRLEEGICIRLYSEEQIKAQPLVPEPEILRSDLAPLCLELAQWGAADAGELQWMDMPSQASLKQGFELLELLGLVTKERQLTAAGKGIRKLGTEPRLASMLMNIQHQKKSLLSTAIALMALLEESVQTSSDLSRNLYQLKARRYPAQKRIENRARQLAQRVNSRFDLNDVREEEAGLCLALAYPDRVAQKRSGRDGQFVLANGHGGELDVAEPLSVSDYLVAVNLIRSQQGASRIFQAASLDIEELMRFQPGFFAAREWVEWDESKGRLTAEKQERIGKLTVRKSALPNPDNTKMTQALLNYVRRKGLSSLHWNEHSLSLLERLRCGAEWFEEKTWPDFSAGALLDNLDKWIEPYMTGIVSVKGLAKIDLSQALMAYLGWPLNQEIDELLPVYYQLPTGTRKKIVYKLGEEPTLSVRIQEVFGEKTSPVIAEGRKKVVLELLSPAHRPLQKTSDLAGFWKGSYKEVQKEMKGRYPKHPWPDDPASHIATTKTKRQLKS